MYKYFSFILLCYLSNFPLVAQVAINANDANPDASAILDLSSTDKGLLIPRMTAAERDAIASPTPTGLMVYVSDDHHFYFYDGSDWAMLFADNLGNHKANLELDLSGYDLKNSDLITAEDLQIDGSTLNVDPDKNRVGIGTENPKTKLHVYNENNISQLLAERKDFTGVFFNITAGNKLTSIGFEDSGDFTIGPITNIGDLPSTSLGITMTGAGKVGIGTKTPGAKLEVYNGNIILDRGGHSFLKFRNNGLVKSKFGTEEGVFGGSVITNNLIFNNISDGNLVAKWGGIPAMVIDKNGKVGFYTNPTTDLHVASAIRIRGGNSKIGSMLRAQDADGYAKWYTIRNAAMRLGKITTEVWYVGGDTWWSIVGAGATNFLNMRSGEKVILDVLATVRMTANLRDDEDHPFYMRGKIYYRCKNDPSGTFQVDYTQTVKYESPSKDAEDAEKFRAMPLIGQWEAPCDCDSYYTVQMRNTSTLEQWRVKDRVLVIRKY